MEKRPQGIKIDPDTKFQEFLFSQAKAKYDSQVRSPSQAKAKYEEEIKGIKFLLGLRNSLDLLKNKTTHGNQDPSKPGIKITAISDYLEANHKEYTDDRFILFLDNDLDHTLGRGSTILVGKQTLPLCSDQEINRIKYQNFEGKNNWLDDAKAKVKGKKVLFLDYEETMGVGLKNIFGFILNKEPSSKPGKHGFDYSNEEFDNKKSSIFCKILKINNDDLKKIKGFEERYQFVKDNSRKYFFRDFFYEEIKEVIAEFKKDESGKKIVICSSIFQEQGTAYAAMIEHSSKSFAEVVRDDIADSLMAFLRRDTIDILCQNGECFTFSNKEWVKTPGSSPANPELLSSVLEKSSHVFKR